MTPRHFIKNYYLFLYLIVVCLLISAVYYHALQALNSDLNALSWSITQESPKITATGRIEANKGVIRDVSAYNVGIKAQTDQSPCIGASGDNLCELLEQGVKVCAANFVPLYIKLYIQNFGECIVLDRMNARNPEMVDIAMRTGEIKRAKKFGVQKLKVSIIQNFSVK